VSLRALILSVVTSALASGLVSLFAARPARGEQPAPWRVVLVGDDAAAAGLEPTLRDLLGEYAPVDIQRAARLDAVALFRVDAATAAPTAFVIVDGAAARVRAASAGRDRFVFRDLAVAAPPTDLDRERIGQTVKTALATVREGGPGVVDREDAARRLGLAPEPPPPSPPPILEAAAPAALAPAAAPPPSPALHLSVGALYEVTEAGPSVLHGPGLVSRLEAPRLPGRPDLWLMILCDLPAPVRSSTSTAFWVYGYTLRAGASVAVLPKVRLGLGAGLDVVHAGVGSTSDAVSAGFDWATTKVLRVSARIGPTSLFGVALSGSLFAEAAQDDVAVAWILNSPGAQYGVETTVVGGLRGGASIELWWR
jgi:hypothetical protein